ncbi:MAG: MBL fold metallo-hydrolase [Candidatus Azobacteroides sp.]|nr:MBL fold metallo-hydrolase [Candidatus Azobacteroides sp.]
MNAQTFEKDSFKTKSGKNLDIFFIKHSSLILKYNGYLIYVDPVTMFTNYSLQPQADMILVTHEHADHFDPNAIDTLKKENTKIILNLSTRDKLGEGTDIKNGDKINPEPFLSIEAVPAYNTTPGREHFHPKGRDNGYILTIDGLRIYIAGDTEDIPEMNNIKNIDIAFLPVNQPYTMTVDQAVHAAKMIKPVILYPYHYSDTNVEEIKTRLATESPAIEVRIRELQ